MVVGGGGREHALVETLAASPLEPELHAAPGNPGIARLAQVADIPADDLISLRDYAKANEIDLTVVGPEDPLIGGIAEAFWEADLKVFGPSRAAARVEGSKVFAKELMKHAGVPTARFEAFDREGAALAYLRRVGDYPVVVKADGAAGGKGVTVARNREEAEAAVRASFGGKFGAAGERIVIESTWRGGRPRSSSSPTGKLCFLSCPRRTTSASMTETRGRTRGEWGHTPRSCGWSLPPMRPYSRRLSARPSASSP